MRFINKLVLFSIILLTYSSAFSQKVAFISSDMIRDKFPEAKSAQQRVQSMVEDWKRELKFKQQKIEALEFDIKKNRLIWTDQERATKEKELEDLMKNREDFAKSKFEPGGEYDKVTYEIMRPIEEKIHAAVQQVAADIGVDIIFDQSTQPLAYVNYKYDVTLRVLRKLGVDVESLEAELQDKIKKDPRNERRESKTPRRGRGSRKRNNPDEEIKKNESEERKIERNEENEIRREDINPEQFPEKIEPERK